MSDIDNILSHTKLYRIPTRLRLPTYFFLVPVYTTRMLQKEYLYIQIYAGRYNDHLQRIQSYDLILSEHIQIELCIITIFYPTMILH